MAILSKFMTTLTLHLGTIETAYFSGIPNLKFMVFAALAQGGGLGMNVELIKKNEKLDLTTGQAVPITADDVVGDTVSSNPSDNTRLDSSFVSLSYANTIPSQGMIYNFLFQQVLQFEEEGIVNIYNALKDDPSKRP